MKNITVIFIIIISILGLALVIQKTGRTTKVTIKEHEFLASVAKTNTEKEIGLSNKTSLTDDAGTLFIFEKSDYYPFWMKNMKFPIDIIFINNNRIVTIFLNQKVPNPNENIPIVKPEEPSDMVLEINANLSNKYNFKKGDEVKIENL